MNISRGFHRPKPRALVRRAQRGFTLVELMVALTIGVLVAGAAVASLIVARQGFRSTDSNSELRENARFAATLLERVAIQAGFQNVSVNGFTATNAPGLAGYDDTLVTGVDGTSTTAPVFTTSRESGCTVTDTSCLNGSDVLVVNYWGSSISAAGGLPADGAMIDCAGIAEPKLPTRAVSIFHVARATSGEPTLACTYADPATGIYKTVPLVSGVEAMQILYGVRPDISSASPAIGTDTPANAYWTASQLNTGTASQSSNQWSYVRSVRIGLVLRGSVSDSVKNVAASYQVLSASGSAYSFTNNANDTMPTLAVAADGRMRQQIVFTIHLRNQQH